MTISDYRAVSELGPFGNNNPAPRFFTVNNLDLTEILPLGKDNKHACIKISSARLLAFNTSPKEILSMIKNVKGFIYHPRLDHWKNEEQLQFILDYAVIEK